MKRSTDAPPPRPSSQPPRQRSRRRRAPAVGANLPRGYLHKIAAAEPEKAVNPMPLRLITPSLMKMKRGLQTSDHRFHVTAAPSLPRSKRVFHICSPVQRKHRHILRNPNAIRDYFHVALSLTSTRKQLTPCPLTARPAGQSHATSSTLYDRHPSAGTRTRQDLLTAGRPHNTRRNGSSKPDSIYGLRSGQALSVFWCCADGHSGPD